MNSKDHLEVADDGLLCFPELLFWEAGQNVREFAAELLMPEKDIRGHLSGALSLRRLADLKPVWGVSMAALLMRASSLGNITKRKYQYLWTQMSKFGYRRREPIELEPEVPSLLSELIETHVVELGRREDALLEVLHTSPNDFRDYFFPTSHLRAVR